MVIPVYVISGFLGSGKTTVLLNMLTFCKERNLRPAIILNEIGAKNVERDLFADEQVIELLDGCICCTIQDDLRVTLNELIVSEAAIDVLFIEGTGVANPMEIQEVLVSSSMRSHFDLLSVITVIDAGHYIEYQSIFSSSVDVRRLMEDQVLCGSLLVLNKVDSVSSAQVCKVRKKLEKLTGTQKELVECSFGHMDEQTLFARRFAVLQANVGQACTSHAAHTHSAVQVLCMEHPPLVTKRDFEKWLKQLPSGVVRGKGTIRFKQSNALFHFQYASGKVQYREMVDASRDCIIVLIGIGIDVEQIKRDFDTLFG